MSLNYHTPAVIPVLIATALLVYVLVRVWHSRHERTAPWLIATIIILLSWSLGLIMELTNNPLGDKLFWANLEFVPIMCLPLVWVLTLRRIVDARAPRQWWQVAGWLITALLIACVFVNPDHLYRGHSTIQVVSGEPALNYDYRILFYAGFVPWAAAMLVASAALLIRGMSQTPIIFRRRNQVLLAASLLPMAGLAVYLTNTLPWHSFDPTFLCVSGAVLLCGFAVLRYRVLDVVPLARDAVIEQLAGGVIVLDAGDRVIDFNPAARAICPGLDREAIGCAVHEVLPDHPAIIEAVRYGGAARAHDLAGMSTGATRGKGKTAASLADGQPARLAALADPGADEGLFDDATVMVEVGDDSTSLAGQRHFAVSLTPVRDRFGKRVASAIILSDVTRRMQLYREIRQLAATDELTGLFTRRHFRHLANQELARALRHGLPVSVLVFDIDEFKDVNDSFGHEAGDDLLRSIATVCREQLRMFDVISRYGGDEFCALLPQVPLAQAVQVGERLCKAVAAYEHTYKERVFRVTISVGVAGVDVLRTETLGDLIRSADDALYRAKREGKNRVVR